MVKRTLIGFICFLFITSCSFLEIKPSGTSDDVCLSAPKTSRICSVAKGLNWNLTDMNNKIMKANLVAIASGQITCKEITDTTSEIRNLLIALPQENLTYEKMIYFLKDASTTMKKGIVISLILIGDDINNFIIPEVVDPYDMSIIHSLLNNIDATVNTEGKLLEELLK